MNLEKAIKELKTFANLDEDKELKLAIDRVLLTIRQQEHYINYLEQDNKSYKETIEKIDYLREKEIYQKGYQDGFKQAKFDCEMDKLDGRI